jgi:hypothetical protein
LAINHISKTAAGSKSPILLENGEIFINEKIDRFDGVPHLGVFAPSR